MLVHKKRRLGEGLVENGAPASRRVDRMFRAFSDRTRLRILYLLLDGELCVCSLTEILRIPQPKVSAHLAYLRKAGLVSVRKAGLWSNYSLATAETPLHKSLLACLAECFHDVPEIRDDRTKAIRLRKDEARCNVGARK
jgi:ArsR family transcriptional regulator, arsenate/arsenite/antimonite-responsive transcriptional repressor